VFLESFIYSKSCNCFHPHLSWFTLVCYINGLCTDIAVVKAYELLKFYKWGIDYEKIQTA